MTPSGAAPAIELAARAARGLGLDPAGARALRVASAVTVDLPRAGIVARVEGPAGLATARRQVVAARICERRGVPAMTGRRSISCAGPTRCT